MDHNAWQIIHWAIIHCNDLRPISECQLENSVFVNFQFFHLIEFIGFDHWLRLRYFDSCFQSWLMNFHSHQFKYCLLIQNSYCYYYNFWLSHVYFWAIVVPIRPITTIVCFYRGCIHFDHMLVRHLTDCEWL